MEKLEKIYPISVLLNCVVFGITFIWVEDKETLNFLSKLWITTFLIQLFSGIAYINFKK